MNLKTIIFLTFCLYFSLLPAIDNYPAGSRIAGISNCGVSLPDVWSVSHNQAGLAFLEKITIAIDHQQRFLLKELAISNIALALPIKKGTFGLQISYLGYSKYHESKVGIAYAIKLNDIISFGLQFDLFNSFLQNSNSLKYITFETGFMAKPIENLTIGTHIFNPLPKKWNQHVESDIPFIVSFGASYLIENKILLLSETQFDFKNKRILGFGAEYTPAKQLALRIGVSSGEYQYSFGISYNWKNFQTNFAFRQHQVLGTTPSVDIIYGL